jgi:hypothetical protein
MIELDEEAIEAAIRKWHERTQEVLARIEAIDVALGLTPESPLHATTWALVGGYIDALDLAYSIGGWLEWWFEECDLGRSPLQAGMPDEAIRTIATVDDLVSLILDDLRRG